MLIAFGTLYGAVSSCGYDGKLAEADFRVQRKIGMSKEIQTFGFSETPVCQAHDKKIYSCKRRNPKLSDEFR